MSSAFCLKTVAAVNWGTGHVTKLNVRLKHEVIVWWKSVFKNVDSDKWGYYTQVSACNSAGNTEKTNFCCRYEGKRGEERNLVVFKDTSWITISMESSERDLFIDMVVDRFILTHYRPAMSSGNKKKQHILEDLFSSVLSQFKKISPPWKPEI